MLSVAFGQSKYFIDNLSENVKRGIRQKLRRGEFPGRAPRGYMNDPRLKTVEPDPKTFDKVKKALELFATGDYTISGIRDEMFKLGLSGPDGKPLYLSPVVHMLTNPFYYGQFLFKGELHQGIHKPMISKPHFDSIQKALRDHGRPRKNGRRKEFLFLGFASCGGCGYSITAEKHTKKSGREYVYYRCTRKSKSQKCEQSRFLREDRLEAQITEICQNAALPAAWRDRCLAKIDEWEKDAGQASALGAQNLKAELDSTKKRIDRLLDLYLDGGLEQADFQQKKNNLMENKAKLEAKIADFERQGDQRLELLKNWVIEASSLEDIVRRGNFSAMKNFLQNHGSNRRLTNGAFKVDLQKPWSYIARAGGRDGAEGAGEASNSRWLGR